MGAVFVKVRVESSISVVYAAVRGVFRVESWHSEVKPERTELRRRVGIAPVRNSLWRVAHPHGVR